MPRDVTIVATIGGILALAFACTPILGIAWCWPLAVGMDWKWYPLMVIVPTVLVIAGSALYMRKRTLGASLIGVGGVLLAIGYASPVSLIGLIFVYISYRAYKLRNV